MEITTEKPMYVTSNNSILTITSNNSILITTSNNSVLTITSNNSILTTTSNNSILTTTSNNSILTTSNSVNETEYHNLKEGHDFLAKYYIWVIFAFGFPGNLLSFFVILRMSRRRLTTSLFYVALLAIVDNIAIVLKIIENQIRNNNVPMAAGSCKVLHFLGLTFASYPNWILIIMSAERLTAVRIPVRVGLIWTLKRAVWIIVGVLVFLCLTHLHLFFTIEADKQHHCAITPKFASFIKPGWFFISSTIYAFIPAVSLTVCNIMIIVFLKKFYRRRRTALSYQSQSNDTRHQERQVTVMLLTLAIVFITLTIPRCIFVVCWSYWKPTDVNGRMWKNFLNVLTSNIADSNHALNFYLYFVSGRKFRFFFLKIFDCDQSQYSMVLNGNIRPPVRPVAESGM